MPSVRIVDTSPLIFLTRAGLLEVLTRPGRRVLMPAAVRDEIGGHGEDDPTARAIRESAWLELPPTPPIPEAIRQWRLGPGESAALALALGDPDREVVLDDRGARRCAESLGIPTLGSLGLILAAKRLAMIPEARTVLLELRRSGMYLSDDILRRALATVGETL